MLPAELAFSCAHACARECVRASKHSSALARAVLMLEQPHLHIVLLHKLFQQRSRPAWQPTQRSTLHSNCSALKSWGSIHQVHTWAGASQI